MQTEQPSQIFISIITVTYNAEKYLEETIQSIIQQTCKDYEYIIVDGGSEDATVDIIKKYDQYIHFWISEPDKGIYDAMNKGMLKANGKYLWFMNAGDQIHHPDTLEKIYQFKSQNPDIFFGETLMYSTTHQILGTRSEVTPLKLPQKLHWKSLQRGMVVCHQSFIGKRKFQLFYDFEKHPYSADIDWIIRYLKVSRSVIHTQEVLSNYLLGGFSKQYLKASLIDRYKILRKHYGLINNLVNHLLIVLRFIWFKLKRGNKV